MSETQGYKNVSLGPDVWHEIKLSVWKLAQLSGDHAVMAGERGDARQYWMREVEKAEALHKRLEAL